jgi:hypothetical protein
MYEFCGDGKINNSGTEDCDNGKLCEDGTTVCGLTGHECDLIGGGTCTSDPNDNCGDDCHFACGDGVVEDGEDCDPGADVPGDCCTADCKFETPETACGSNSDTACDNPDTCNAEGVCQTNHETNGTNCGDEGTACVNQDTCLEGVCHDNGFKTPGTSCGSNSDTDCDNPDTCDGSGTCQPNNETDGANCGDAGTQCTNQDTCLAGVCLDKGFKDSGTPCGSSADTDCDNPDTCNGAGSCQSNHEAPGTACTDDGNSCTDDKCNSDAVCTHPNDDTNTCSDGNACTTNDACSAGECVGGAPLSCDDQNGCTDDSCDPQSGCQHSNNTNACDDDLFCNGHEVCGGGTCNPGTPPNCNDGVSCTDDFCNEDTDSCGHTPDNEVCDDQNACTDDVCNPGPGPGPKSVEISGCQHTNNTNPCEDGLVCNGHEVCGDGTCNSGTAPNCDDGNSCTDDTCQEPAQCIGGPSPDCNVETNCVGGTCNNFKSGLECDGCPPPTAPKVAEEDPSCHHTNNTAPCDDGIFCDGTDTCADGSCGHSGDPCVDSGDDCHDTCDEDTDTCVPGTTPNEVCNGVDDDCDGQVDEGFDVGGACTVGVGACERGGHMVCNADGTGVVCDATPGTPNKEVCGNNVDEDCNGDADVCGEVASCIRTPGNTDPTVDFSDPKKGGDGTIAIEYAVVDDDPAKITVAATADIGTATLNDDGKTITYTLPKPLQNDQTEAVVTVQVVDGGTCNTTEFKKTMELSAAGSIGAGCSLIREGN